MTRSLKQSQAINLNYAEHGVQLLGSLPRLSERVFLTPAFRRSAERRDKATGGRHGGYGIEREFHDLIVDGDKLYDASPRFFELYMECHQMAHAMLLDHVVNLSPWRRSAMTLKFYTQPGDQHGWHVETNGLTVLVCVEGAARLDIMDGPQPPHPEHEGDFHLIMRPGQAYILRGHDVWHRVPPLLESDLPRTTMVMNYYLDDDFSRPAGLDGQHYA